MYLKYHFISCIILSIILFPFFNYLSLLVFVLGFFIDADHYFYDVLTTRKLSIKNSYNLHMDKSIIRKDQLHIFHTLEFIVSFIFLTITSKNTYLILLSIGLILHLILDVLHGIILIKKRVKMNQTRAYSFLFWIMRN